MRSDIRQIILHKLEKFLFNLYLKSKTSDHVMVREKHQIKIRITDLLLDHSGQAFNFILSD